MMDNLADFFLTPDPFQSFRDWADAAKAKGDSHDQFILASVSGQQPNARVLLLKELESKGAVFFTNYSSIKGKELNRNPNVSLVFWWAKLGRQVRIQGAVEKISDAASEKYFHSREKASQIASHISKQSSILKDRKELEDKFLAAQAEFKDSPVPRPKDWGGYLVKPSAWEFFLYRDHRLNDRFEFTLSAGAWTWQRLSP